MPVLCFFIFRSVVKCIYMYIYKNTEILKILKILKIYWSYKLYYNEVLSNVILLRNHCFGRRSGLVYPETF